MKVKRGKKAKKAMANYVNSLGFREPYQFIVDGTFCQAALEAKIHIKEAVPAYLNATVNLMTTGCLVAEVEALGEEFLGTKLVLKRFEKRSCKHGSKPVSAAECLASFIAPDNQHRYGVCTLDPLLKEEMAKVPGVPILTIHRSIMILEKPSQATKDAIESQKMGAITHMSEYERTLLARLNAKPKLKSDKSMKRKPIQKKKKAKGPNPLSQKKKVKPATKPAAQKPSGGGGDA